jgi:hypothetical protein
VDDVADGAAHDAVLVLGDAAASTAFTMLW